MMKRILLIVLLAFGFALQAQTPFPSGIRLSNATETATADSIPVIGANGVIKKYISRENLVGGGDQNNKVTITTLNFNGEPVKNNVELATYINANTPLVVAEDENLVVETNYTNVGNVQKIKYLFKAGKGTWGDSGTAITANDIYEISREILNLSPQEDPNTQFIDLGTLNYVDIPYITSLVNAFDPCETIQNQNEGYVILEGDYGGETVQYLFTDTGGSYGDGCNHTSDEFIAILTDVNELPNTQFIDLGDISSSTIEDVINAQNPCLVLQNQNEGYVIANTVRNGIVVQWLFNGNGGSYGDGCGQTMAEDWTELNAFFDTNFAWVAVEGSANHHGHYDPEIPATSNTGDIAHEGTVIVKKLRVRNNGTETHINNIGYFPLRIGGNYGVEFTGSNPNHTRFRFTKGSPIPNTYNGKNAFIIDNDRTGNILSNLQSSSFRIEGEIDISTQGGNSSHSFIDIDPTTAIGGANPIYALNARKGDIRVNDLAAPSGETYKVVVDDDGVLSSVADSGGGTSLKIYSESGDLDDGDGVATIGQINSFGEGNGITYNQDDGTYITMTDSDNDNNVSQLYLGKSYIEMFNGTSRLNLGLEQVTLGSYDTDNDLFIDFKVNGGGVDISAGDYASITRLYGLRFPEENGSYSRFIELPSESGKLALLSDITGGGEWGDITGTLSDQTDLQDALDDKQDVITGAASTVVSSDLIANRMLMSDSSGKITEKPNTTANRALISNGNGSSYIASTVTSTELNYLSGIGSNVQKQLDDKVENLSDLSITATASELNTLDGITATTTELNYTDGVTSNIQDQLDDKIEITQPANTGTGTVISLNNAITGTIYNYATPSTATNFITTGLIVGGKATNFIDTTGAATFPTVNSSTGGLLTGSAFQAGKTYQMVITSYDGTTYNYYFLLFE